MLRISDEVFITDLNDQIRRATRAAREGGAGAAGVDEEPQRVHSFAPLPYTCTLHIEYEGAPPALPPAPVAPGATARIVASVSALPGADLDRESACSCSFLLFGVRGDERITLCCASAPGLPPSPSSPVPPGARHFYAPSAAAIARAVEDGFRLTAALALADPPPRGGGDAAAFAGSAAGMGSMLGGPFADAVVRAGGREFSAHRAVLAAASPVFFSMLATSGMREAHTAAVDLPDADPECVDLLLRHAYGETVLVPVSRMVGLYALADQYQIKSALAWQLLAALAALPLAPAVLCTLLPEAHSVCGAACEASLYPQAAAVADDLAAMPDMAGWPAECLAAVLPHAPPVRALHAAAAWAAGQPAASAAEVWCRVWPRLLGLIQFDLAKPAELRQLWATYCGGSTGTSARSGAAGNGTDSFSSPSGGSSSSDSMSGRARSGGGGVQGGAGGCGSCSGLPGVADALFQAMFTVCCRQEHYAARTMDMVAHSEKIVTSQAEKIQRQEARIAELEMRVVQWQGYASRVHV